MVSGPAGLLVGSMSTCERVWRDCEPSEALSSIIFGVFFCLYSEAKVSTDNARLENGDNGWKTGNFRLCVFGTDDHNDGASRVETSTEPVFSLFLLFEKRWCFLENS